MTQFLLVMAVALTAGAIVFGISVLVTGGDGGLRRVEPDGRAIPLPAERPLAESDLSELRFDTALRGYRMAQVDAALRRAGYDIGYKDELIKVLQAEVDALRDGRLPDAEVYRRAREAALAPIRATTPAEPTEAAPAESADAASAEPTETGPAEPTDAAPAEPTETGPAEPTEAEPTAAGSAESTDAPAEPAAGGPDEDVDSAPATDADAESDVTLDDLRDAVPEKPGEPAPEDTADEPSGETSVLGHR